MDPLKTLVIAGQIRTVFAALSGAGLLFGAFAWFGKLTEEQISGLLSAGIIIVSGAGYVWSALASRWAKLKDDAKTKAALAATAAVTAAETASATHAAGEPTPVPIVIPVKAG